MDFGKCRSAAARPIPLSRDRSRDHKRPVMASAPMSAAPAAAGAPLAAAVVAPTPALLAQLVTQVEYYLSDTNLARDAFFRKALAAGEGGCVRACVRAARAPGSSRRAK